MDTQIYKVKDPDGNVREIQGPKGASDEEIITQAKALFGGDKAKPGAEAIPTTDGPHGEESKIPTGGLTSPAKPEPKVDPIKTGMAETLGKAQEGMDKAFNRDPSKAANFRTAAPYEEIGTSAVKGVGLGAGLGGMLGGLPGAGIGAIGGGLSGGLAELAKQAGYGEGSQLIAGMVPVPQGVVTAVAPKLEQLAQNTGLAGLGSKLGNFVKSKLPLGLQLLMTPGEKTPISQAAKQTILGGAQEGRAAEATVGQGDGISRRGCCCQTTSTCRTTKGTNCG